MSTLFATRARRSPVATRFLLTAVCLVSFVPTLVAQELPSAAHGDSDDLPLSVTITEVTERAIEILSGELRVSPTRLRSVADLLRLARRFELSAQIYGVLFDLTGDYDALYLQAQQLAQIGEFEVAGRFARRVVSEAKGDDSSTYELKRRAYALMARTLFYRGRVAEAERLLQTLAALDDVELVEVDALLLLASVQSTMDLEPHAHEQLERLFPTSLARELSAGRVQPSSTPAMLLQALGDEPDTGRATVASPPAAREASAVPEGLHAVKGIQVGTFSDPDNANHMARDIEALGLEAEVWEQTREGRSIQVVVALVSEERNENADRVLSTLRDAGLDGFLIY
ncbi:MAG: SPOR domain-containing protein [Spirochaetales bacterium]